MLNRDHLATPAVEALTSLRATLIERLKETLASWDPAPTHASVFGSVARGDGGTDSDIDLLLVRPDSVDEEDNRWRRQIDDLTADAERWTGNRLAPLELDESGVRRLARDRPPLVGELRSDAITLLGSGIRTLLGPR
jgi:predicted nucleotidyltransferase